MKNNEKTKDLFIFQTMIIKEFINNMFLILRKKVKGYFTS